MQRRFTIRGVTYGDQLFLFDEFFCRQTAAVMSRLMQITSSGPKTVKQALALAKIDLAMADYNFQDPGRLVISNAAQVPASPDSLPGADIHDIRDVVRPPTVRQEESGFAVDFFTSDLRLPWVRHDPMTIGSEGFQDVASQQIFPNHVSVKILEQEKRNDRTSGKNQRVLFQVEAMGEGRTSNGGPVNLQHSDASDGPGVELLDSSYPLSALADAAWQAILKSAISVTDSGPWIDEHGQISGMKALVIFADQDEKTIWAEQVILGEATLRPILCARNGNLMAAVRKPDFSNIVLP